MHQHAKCAARGHQADTWPIESVFQHILCIKYNDTSDTFLCHDSLRSTRTVRGGRVAVAEQGSQAPQNALMRYATPAIDMLASADGSGGVVSNEPRELIEGTLRGRFEAGSRRPAMGFQDAFRSHREMIEGQSVTSQSVS